jgi:formylglycine-generating enzyme required for sulfatase activity
MGRPLTCLAGLAAAITIAVIGAYAGSAQRESTVAGIESCATYPGVPPRGDENAGMAFIPGGTFRMGSERSLRRRVSQARAGRAPSAP